MTRLEMTRAEIREILRANIGKHLHITFENGTVQSVEIGFVDDEGFVHGGNGGGNQPPIIWRRFEEVKHIHSRLSPCAASTPGNGSTSAPKWVTLGPLSRRKRKSFSC